MSQYTQSFLEAKAKQAHDLRKSVFERSQKIRQKEFDYGCNQEEIRRLEAVNDSIQSDIDELECQNKTENEQLHLLLEDIEKMKSGSKTPRPRPSLLTKTPFQDALSVISNDEDTQAKQKMVQTSMELEFSMENLFIQGNAEDNPFMNVPSKPTISRKVLEVKPPLPTMGDFKDVPVFDPHKPDAYQSYVCGQLGIRRESALEKMFDLDDLVRSMQSLNILMGCDHGYHVHYKREFFSKSEAAWQKCFQHDDEIDEDAKVDLLRYRIACILFHKPIPKGTVENTQQENLLFVQGDLLGVTGTEQRGSKSPLQELPHNSPDLDCMSPPRNSPVAALPSSFSQHQSQNTACCATASNGGSHLKSGSASSRNDGTCSGESVSEMAAYATAQRHDSVAKQLRFDAATPFGQNTRKRARSPSAVEGRLSKSCKDNHISTSESVVSAVSIASNKTSFSEYEREEAQYLKDPQKHLKSVEDEILATTKKNTLEDLNSFRSCKAAIQILKRRLGPKSAYHSLLCCSWDNERQQYSDPKPFKSHIAESGFNFKNLFSYRDNDMSSLKGEAAVDELKRRIIRAFRHDGFVHVNTMGKAC